MPRGQGEEFEPRSTLVLTHRQIAQPYVCYCAELPPDGVVLTVRFGVQGIPSVSITAVVHAAVVRGGLLVDRRVDLGAHCVECCQRPRAGCRASTTLLVLVPAIERLLYPAAGSAAYRLRLLRGARLSQTQALLPFSPSQGRGAAALQPAQPRCVGVRALNRDFGDKSQAGR